MAIRAADRGRLSPGELQAQLVHILVEASSSPAAPRVGLLTAMSRDNWARARHQLAQGKEAKQANFKFQVCITVCP